MTHPVSDEILDYWFGPFDGRTNSVTVANHQSALWWSGQARYDVEIQERFSDVRLEAIEGALDDWLHQARSRLALIILVDQFSRNIFRGTHKSFAFDYLARRWCDDGIAAGHDLELTAIERVFFYLPLEHSEFIEDQKNSIEQFEALKKAVPEEEQGLYDGYLEFAQRHHDIITRFNRFPHRNEIFLRPSTNDELRFLQQPGSSF